MCHYGAMLKHKDMQEELLQLINAFTSLEYVGIRLKLNSLIQNALSSL